MASPRGLLEAAFADHRRGDWARAARKYRQVLRAQPGNPDALYLFGMLCLEEGKAEEAARSLERAVAAAAKAGRAVDPGWRLALGSARQRLGEHERALAEFDAALRAGPANLDALFCRATALQDLGRSDEAAAAYEALLKRAPGHAEALNNLGILHRDSGRPDAAMRAFRAAVRAQPGHAVALEGLGRLLLDVGHAGEAVGALERAAAAKPDDAGLRSALFSAMIRAGRIEEAERRIRAELERRPEDAGLLANLGHALLFGGRRADAIEAFRRAVALDPARVGARIGLAEAGDHERADDHVPAIRELLKDPSLADADRATLGFALAKHLETRGEHGQAFEAYRTANRMKREALVVRGFAYDRAEVERADDALRAAFPPGSLDAPGASGDERPVFVVGMPRSGTTLVEQVLASHPRVHGGGELPFMRDIAARLGERAGYPAKPLPAAALDRAAAAYLAAIDGPAGGAARVTDKLPGNYRHLGLIARLFANARIIHCRRDPMDTCLSCFTQNFESAGLVWSCDLGDLAHQYCQYRRLMEHWRAALPPGRMIEVDYEALVADLEGEARRLVGFVGLEWDDACLRFHETERAVTTASHSQVRQPVYRSSVGRWRRYGDAVLPLARGLAACGCAPDAS